VYLARDLALERPVALKLLPGQFAHLPELRARFLREARTAAGLSHPNIVPVHAVEEHGTVVCFMMAYVSGGTLAARVREEGPLPPAEVSRLMQEVAWALAYAHQHGVIHRDIKPANLHQGEDGVLRLLDLGVALSGREAEAMRHLHAGTPSYINPEQWGFAIKAGGVDTDAPAEDADAHSDLFALGVTLYQLLTDGKLPYGEVLPHQSGRYYRDPTAPSRHNPEVPIWLDHVVLKAVARDRRQRFETAEEFLLALERGASRPLTASTATPLIQRDPTMVWKLLLGISGLFNLLLIYWLLFLPK